MIKLIIFMVFVMTVGVAEADLAEFSPGITNNSIHSVTVTILGSCDPDLYLSTRVGKMGQGGCQYSKETPSTHVPFWGPNTTYSLNGERLTQLVGLGYDCAATHANIGAIEGYDSFLLISDQDKYIDTDKKAGTIALPFSCLSN